MKQIKRWIKDYFSKVYFNYYFSYRLKCQCTCCHKFYEKLKGDEFDICNECFTNSISRFNPNF